MIQHLPFNYKRLRYFLYMGVAWTSLGMIQFVFESDFGFLLTIIPFWVVFISLGVIHLLLWLIYKFNSYVIIDSKSILQNKIVYKKQLFFDQIEHVDEYAGDYIFFGEKEKITLKKESFTLDGHDIIKEVAEKLKKRLVKESV